MDELDKLRDLLRLCEVLLGYLDGTRHFDRVGADSIAGLCISTVLTPDRGYETAILDKIRAMPVERYETREQAVAGHEKWKKAAPNLKSVVRLGYASLLPDEVFELVPERVN